MSEAECRAEFAALFPQGVAGGDVLAAVAPEGWSESPLKSAFHPTAETIFEESLAFHRNLESLSKNRAPDGKKPAPAPTLEEIQRDFAETPVVPGEECAQLVGECLWDVFSDNHEVVADDGRVADIGSFRGAGGFIAEFAGGAAKSFAPDANALSELMPGMPELPPGMPAFDMGYMQFYMGSIRTAQRVDLAPVYQMIFRRLQDRGLDWIYHFPRLSVVDMRPLRDRMKEDSGEKEWESYDPSQALADEEEDRIKDRELAEMRESLDQSHRESVERAKDLPPPRTVAAYRSVYGRWPEGWPPE